MNIQEYYTGFMQDIMARSGAVNDFDETTFTERTSEFLVEHAILSNYSYVGFKKTGRGMRVDAWDLNEEMGLLTLLVTDFRSNKLLENLTGTEAAKLFKRAEKFFEESLDRKFHASIEESAAGFELAKLIYDTQGQISKVRFILSSNARLSTRIDFLQSTLIRDFKCEYDIWDISRLYRIESSENMREDITIDFREFIPEGIRCLPAYTHQGSLESYLLVVPGELIADLYDKFGERLLEQNVRTFLQFRGSVNKGIRNTIQNEPDMFFAYNNGLTATAENVVTDGKKERLFSLSNLQIVNGGQTTASIYTARRLHRLALDPIYVQVKLTIIPPDRVEKVVPRISEYANTQNRVTAADFFSNHPFHLRIEEFSRRLWVPSPIGGLRETHWFYERARGQYANAQARLTPAQAREFVAKYPRNQMFTKTDLAKFEHSTEMLPNIVSLGAQKNFARFASEIGARWEKNDHQFNELYFRQLIARAILFQSLDRRIMKEEWYGGYKANIVTYSLSKLANTLSELGKQLDYEAIWKQQKISEALLTQLLRIAKVVNERIQETPPGITNVTEWCKKEQCWKMIRELKIPLSENLLTEMIDLEEAKDLHLSAEKKQDLDDGISVQTYVLDKGKDFWIDVAKFGLEHRLLGEKEMGIIQIACEIPEKIPTEKQARVIKQIEAKVIAEGFYREGD